MEKDGKITEKWQRISEIRHYFCNGNNVEFANILGKKDTYTSQICNGSKTAGDNLLNLILEKFPKVSRSWLILGEGPMLSASNDEFGMSSENIGQKKEEEKSIYSMYSELLERYVDLQSKFAQVSAERSVLADRLSRIEGEVNEETERQMNMMMETHQGMRHIGFNIAAIANGLSHSTSIPKAAKEIIQNIANETADVSPFIPKDPDEDIDITKRPEYKF